MNRDDENFLRQVEPNNYHLRELDQQRAREEQARKLQEESIRREAERQRQEAQRRQEEQRRYQEQQRRYQEQNSRNQGSSFNSSYRSGSSSQAGSSRTVDTRAPRSAGSYSGDSSYGNTYSGSSSAVNVQPRNQKVPKFRSSADLEKYGKEVNDNFRQMFAEVGLDLDSLTGKPQKKNNNILKSVLIIVVVFIIAGSCGLF